MPDSALSAIDGLFGKGGDLTIVQMSMRALVIYIAAITLVRLGDKRFMGKNTAFDLILAIVLGSVMSRAITGNAPFLPVVAACATLVFLHAVLAVLSFHSHRFGTLVKGRERELVKEGEIDWESMRKSHISRNDLDEALYRNGKVTSLADVAVARVERNGEISVIPRRERRDPRIVEISVGEGVQTVRIELS